MEIREEIKQQVQHLSVAGAVPGLAVILVGEDPASRVYVRNKARACEKAGIYSITDQLPATISEEALLEKVNTYNHDPRFHGLLVQLPLPKHINEQKIIESIHPEKDVDCFHPYNVGRLMIGKPVFQPATPAGIMELLKRSGINPDGKHAVVLGRSNIVGKPIAMMLVQKHTDANAVITIAHTGTKNISAFSRQADILIVAIGRPEVVRADMVKEGAVVIDVGVNRVEADNEKGYRLAGDVAFEEVLPRVSAITPVPGGVGPMTIAMLLKNTLTAFRIQQAEGK